MTGRRILCPDEPIYEYACHEGNYALPGILAARGREDVRR